jgi:hypothetical protein
MALLIEVKKGSGTDANTILPSLANIGDGHPQRAEDRLDNCEAYMTLSCLANVGDGHLYREAGRLDKLTRI